MENDSIYRRININSVIRLVAERNPDMSEIDVRNLAYKTVAELNKNIDEMVDEFERGEGLFDTSYFSAK